VTVPPPQLPDMPPGARGCWEAKPEEVEGEAMAIILDQIARQPLACGVLLGRTDVVEVD